MEWISLSLTKIAFDLIYHFYIVAYFNATSVIWQRNEYRDRMTLLLDVPCCIRRAEHGGASPQIKKYVSYKYKLDIRPNGRHMWWDRIFDKCDMSGYFVNPLNLGRRQRTRCTLCLTYRSYVLALGNEWLISEGSWFIIQTVFSVALIINSVILTLSLIVKANIA